MTIETLTITLIAACCTASLACQFRKAWRALNSGYLRCPYCRALQQHRLPFTVFAQCPNCLRVYEIERKRL